MYVIWGTVRSGYILVSPLSCSSVALDSTSERTLPLPDGLKPTSLAFDWKGGHIFSLESPGFQIELTTINGQEVGSVLDFSGLDKRYSLNVSGEVAFDTATR